ncbi:hypothetical protein CKAH01_07632 [Colletotrichum kahawae]|uniref:Uncharacterized protein n=1 Tax=Colletotrichum kahawae TaxID=34407 RepID=A0AAD9Y5D8_COLKA|nr:hypothetical protein CKAH01_07632 [Colletotrichum kahawae]
MPYRASGASDAVRTTLSTRHFGECYTVARLDWDIHDAYAHLAVCRHLLCETSSPSYHSSIFPVSQIPETQKSHQRGRRHAAAWCAKRIVAACGPLRVPLGPPGGPHRQQFAPNTKHSYCTSTLNIALNRRIPTSAQTAVRMLRLSPLLTCSTHHDRDPPSRSSRPLVNLQHGLGKPLNHVGQSPPGSQHPGWMRRLSSTAVLTATSSRCARRPKPLRLAHNSNLASFHFILVNEPACL